MPTYDANMNELKIGDLVLIKDGSYAVRLDRYEKYSSIGCNTNTFEVIYINNYPPLQTGSLCSNPVTVHNIHIKDLTTGAIYLHSSRMVVLKENRKMEKLMKDIELLSECINYSIKLKDRLSRKWEEICHEEKE